jgi:hypothetical protein
MDWRKATGRICHRARAAGVFTAIAVVFWMVGRREQAAGERELESLDHGGMSETGQKMR